MSVKKLLLHIGTPKTATTTIQKTLNDYAKENLIEGFIYPDFGSVNHHDLMVLFKSYDRIPRSLKGKYPNLKSYEEGRLNLKKSFNNLFLNSNNVLLSTEYFFTMNQEEINNLKNELSYVKDLEIMICIYVRDPLSYYVSYVQQYCKASKNIPNPIKFRYNFKSIILKWEEYFPNIMVKPFSKEKFLNGCIVQDFMQVVNAFFDINCELSLNTKASNESLSLEALYVLIFYRRYFYSDEDNVFYPDSNRLINLMLNLTKNLNLTKLTLNENIKEILYSNHIDEILWLKNQYSIDFTIDLKLEKSTSFLNTNQENNMIKVEHIFKDLKKEKVEILLCELVRKLIYKK